MKLLFRLLTLLFFTLTTLSANAQAPILTADAAILIDARTGQVLYEKNADKREYPASMTKMMTCILALERGILSKPSLSAPIPPTSSPPSFAAANGSVWETSPIR